MNMPLSISLWTLLIVAISHPIGIGCDVQFPSIRTTYGNSNVLKLDCLIKPLARKDAAVPTVGMTE